MRKLAAPVFVCWGEYHKACAVNVMVACVLTPGILDAHNGWTEYRGPRSPSTFSWWIHMAERYLAELTTTWPRHGAARFYQRSSRINQRLDRHPEREPDPFASPSVIRQNTSRRWQVRNQPTVVVVDVPDLDGVVVVVPVLSGVVDVVVLEVVVVVEVEIGVLEDVVLKPSVVVLLAPLVVGVLVVRRLVVLDLPVSRAPNPAPLSFEPVVIVATHDRAASSPQLSPSSGSSLLELANRNVTLKPVQDTGSALFCHSCMCCHCQKFRSECSADRQNFEPVRATTATTAMTATTAAAPPTTNCFRLLLCTGGPAVGSPSVPDGTACAAGDCIVLEAG